MYNIITYKEGSFFVGKVLENNVSSFGDTEKQAYNNTVEALELYNEDNNKEEDIKISSPKFYSLNINNA